VPLTGRVLIAANRLPVVVRLDDDALEIVPSPGGLATSMRHVHDKSGSRWIGWPGDLARADDAERGRIKAALGERRLVPVELSGGEVNRYYDGFSNGVLWPLFHYLIERVKRDAASDWNAYRVVNERFASAIVDAWQPGDLIWVHDYHLLLVPGLLRRRIPDAVIGLFLHIPFPAADVFRVLPAREAVLRGMLGADLVGFHTADYAQHFRYAATQLVGAEDHGDELVFEDRRIHAGVHPIGIDVATFAEPEDASGVAEQTDRWRAGLHGRRIILGVDRLDYTKGIVRRLLAIERLFERWPAWRERLNFVQLAVPTRERSDEYAIYRREVHELIGRINGRFGTPGWTPIHFVHRTVSHTELVALYRAAEVMLVTPLRDGMNLVAKEYCASRIDDRGVLVLSEMTGAAAELREALLVNPYDIDAVAAAIRRALEMGEVEQKARMTALRATVSTATVSVWAERFLAELAAAAAAPAHVGPRLADATAALGAALTPLRAAERRLLLLDYDGTLVPFAAMPELAFPDDDLRTLLGTLAGDPANRVHVISGRSRGSLDAWLGDLPVGLHAEHGFWSRWPGEAWASALPAPSDALGAIDGIMAEVVRRTPGSFVERKGASLAWHYRMSEPILAARRLDELRRRIQAALPADLELLDGNKVLEVRMRGADKTAVGQRIIARDADAETAILAIGDDRTDEDLFRALPPGAITVRVGPGASRAGHRIDGPDEVRALL
jgi:trehalose 6-phosphate synthase/phosphatase